MKVGIIGLGDRIASLAPKFLSANPELEFLAVADPHADRMPVLERLGAARSVMTRPKTCWRPINSTC